jgi:hypothetical protein
MRWRIAGFVLLALMAARAESQTPAPTPSIAAAAIPSPIPSVSSPPPASGEQGGKTFWSEFKRLDPNWVIVLLTIALALLANEDRKLNNRTIAHTIAVERSYVDMSHKPPGIFSILGGGSSDPQSIATMTPKLPLCVSIQVTNHGHTPADITAVVVTCYVGKSLPDQPPYTDHTTWGAYFLMPNEGRFVASRVVHSGLRSEDVALINSEQLFFWVIGYVDYTDVFNKQHRAGYARRYSPAAHDNNLVSETKPGYNYDKTSSPDQRRTVASL